MKLNILFLTGILFACFSNFADAQVYKWTDKEGITHYSSSKPDSKATPAKLPSIIREKSSKIPVQLSFSCSSHGGINCQAGPDADGSVICTDGFKEAIARFKFRCESTKLTVLELEKKDKQLSVWIRNERDIAALGVEIALTLPDGSSIKADGPETLDPSGLAEFTFPEAEDDKAYTLAQVATSCQNCG